MRIQELERLNSVPFAKASARSYPVFCAPSTETGTVHKNGAGNGNRTRDLQLGKLTLYRLSYARSLTRIITSSPKAGYWARSGSRAGMGFPRRKAKVAPPPVDR